MYVNLPTVFLPHPTNTKLKSSTTWLTPHLPHQKVGKTAFPRRHKMQVVKWRSSKPKSKRKSQNEKRRKTIKWLEAAAAVDSSKTSE